MKSKKIKELIKKTIVEIVNQSSKPNLSHDASLFLKVRQGMKEAIDIGNYPDFIDPEKRASIENEADFIENALPEPLGPEANRYLEIVTGEAYKKALDRAAHYLGTTVDQLHQRFPHWHTAMGLLMQTAQQVEQLEANSKPQLEAMAVEVVLNLDENKYIKALVQKRKILLDVKLGGADLAQGIAEDEMDQEQQNGLTVQENLDVQVASVLMGETEGKLKRSLANFITQGDAINKFFLYNLVSERLAQIDPTLPQKYGLLSATSLVLNYWQPNAPFTRAFINSSAVGSEQVVPQDEIYTIRVRGANFPMLIHELVKGINEYLSMDIASQEELSTEKLSDEMKQFLVGPGIDMKLRSMIPVNKVELLPYIKKLIYRLPIEHIKELFAGGGKSQSIMRKIIQTAEQQVKGQGGED
jgi:hypothetical protein